MAWNEIIILYSHFHVVDVDGTGNATLFSCIISYMFHVKFWHRFLISIESSPTYLRHLLISCKISWLKRTNNARRNKFKNHRFSNSWIRPRLSITLSLNVYFARKFTCHTCIHIGRFSKYSVHFLQMLGYEFSDDTLTLLYTHTKTVERLRRPFKRTVRLSHMWKSYI